MVCPYKCALVHRLRLIASGKAEVTHCDVLPTARYHRPQTPVRIGLSPGDGCIVSRLASNCLNRVLQTSADSAKDIASLNCVSITASYCRYEGVSLDCVVGSSADCRAWSIGTHCIRLNRIA